MWSVQVVKFAAAATIDRRGKRNKLKINLSVCVRNRPELHEGARHILEIWLSETQVLGVLQEVTASGG